MPTRDAPLVVFHLRRAALFRGARVNARGELAPGPALDRVLGPM